MGGMHWCLPLLKNGRKLVFFMNIEPQSFGLNLLAQRRNHLKRNEMHDLKND
jgi:hypothetical protein